jgi:hypothetical protein
MRLIDDGVGGRNLGTFHMEAKRRFGAKNQLKQKWEKWCVAPFYPR